MVVEVGLTASPILLDAAFVPDQPPLAVQDAALEDQVRVVELPGAIVVGVALITGAVEADWLAQWGVIVPLVVPPFDPTHCQ